MSMQMVGEINSVRVREQTQRKIKGNWVCWIKVGYRAFQVNSVNRVNMRSQTLFKRFVLACNET